MTNKSNQLEVPWDIGASVLLGYVTKSAQYYGLNRNRMLVHLASYNPKYISVDFYEGFPHTKSLVSVIEDIYGHN